jgi:hypothetical protein
MADDDRNLIEEYVVSGNMRDDSKALTIDPSRQAELRARLQNLREGAQAGGLPALPADSNPSDFRAAVEERERQAEIIQTRGKDTPRVNADKQPMKAIYFVNDAVAALPSPGGLGGLLLAILVFFFILIPATSAGETRALLLWEVLLGQKQINDPASVPAVDAGTGNVIAAVGGAIGTGIGIGIQAVGLSSKTPPPATPPPATNYLADNVGGGLV